MQGVPPLPRDDLRFSNTTGILQKKKTMWFIDVEVEQETSAPPPKKKSSFRPCNPLCLSSPSAILALQSYVFFFFFFFFLGTT